MKKRHLALVAAAALAASGCAGVQTSDVTRVTGGTLGGVFGGLAGSQFGSGTGQLVFTALGSSLGALFGGAVGGSVGNQIETGFAGPASYGTQGSYQGGYQAPPPGAYQPAVATSSGVSGSDQTYLEGARAMAASVAIGDSIEWSNPETGNFGVVTPIRDGTSSGGQYCREFESAASVAGRSELSYLVACQFADGSWRAVQ